MTLKQVVEPSEPVLTLEQGKSHLRIDADITGRDDDVIDLIAAATAHLEKITDRAFVNQQWQKRLDAFPCSGGAIALEKLPAVSVDRIDFIDRDGVPQTLAPQCYEVDPQEESAWLVPAYGYIWPKTRDQVNAITITFTAGYGVAARVPADIRRAIKLLIRHWYDNPSAVNIGNIVTTLPIGVQSLIAKYCPVVSQ